jgi:hypothetical protein
MKERSEALERECVPAKGVSREEVEKRFGEGRPAVDSKTPVEAPANSPLRQYELCEDGVLWVRYDAGWKVEWAHVPDPYSSKGLPGGIAARPLPLEMRYHEARRRLEQMTRIREECRRRFAEEGGG